jgi:hypothetical protein
MIYYNSRYLSTKLDINLARWKRWVREFLPPDPLGGMQSGVTRQFNTKDAFKVYLGGYLVGNLKFAIPDAVTILSDLSSWLKAQGYFQIHTRPSLNGTDQMVPYHLIIYPNFGPNSGANLGPNPGPNAEPKSGPPPDFKTVRRFSYELRSVVSDETNESGARLLHESRFLIDGDKPDAEFGQFDPMCGFMVALTRLYTDFLEKLASKNEHA